MNGQDTKRKSRKINPPETSQMPNVVLMQSLCIIITGAKIRIIRQIVKSAILQKIYDRQIDDADRNSDKRTVESIKKSTVTRNKIT